MDEEVWGFGVDEDGFLNLFRVSLEHLDEASLAEAHPDVIYFYATLHVS